MDVTMDTVLGFHHYDVRPRLTGLFELSGYTRGIKRWARFRLDSAFFLFS